MADTSFSTDSRLSLDQSSHSFLQEKTKTGYTFSTPYLVTGLTFAGQSEYLDCISSTINSTMDDTVIAESCQETKVRKMIVRRRQ